eukprot:TRINITY_DN2239_c0_g1_i8.p1 TRINITY_DN2239_c0_g1~~TRINITY_DN2239_c0_g1_i8.p1  ORF type:complete len:576 (+),score=84.19 TRINITY_DN2239_c0_g1_i8:95-1822(+)
MGACKSSSSSCENSAVDIKYDAKAAPEIEGGQKMIYRGEFHTFEHGQLNVVPCAVARPVRGYNKNHMREEVTIWEDVSKPGHANILALYHFSKDDCTMAMELVEPIGFDLVALGTLYSYDDGKMMPVAETADIFQKLISAVDYLHSTKKIIHRDLKADQVLITGKQDVKLTDFGLAVHLDRLRTHPDSRWLPHGPPGTSNIAPEIPSKNLPNSPVYDEKVDLYGLGWILAQLYSRLLPRKGHHIPENVLQHESGGDAENRNVLEDLAFTKEHLTLMDPKLRWSLTTLQARKWLKIDGPRVAVVNMGLTTWEVERKHLRKFKQRLVATCAHLQKPFPENGLLLKDVISSDWTCLLVENSDGTYDTFPCADTMLRRGQRIYFGCKTSTTTSVPITSETEVVSLKNSLDETGRLTTDIVVGETELLAGFEMDQSVDSISVGNKIEFLCDPRVRLSRALHLTVSEDLARSENHKALIPFSLEFDAFEIPTKLVSPSAILGPEDFKTKTDQIALDFRGKYRINLACIAKPDADGLTMDWMPGPRSEVVPGCFGLVVRKPTKSGISVPTITDEELMEKGLA